MSATTPATHTNVAALRQGGSLNVLFMDSQDIHDPWGRLRLGANGLRRIGPACGLGNPWIAGVVPGADGSWTVYGIVSTGPHATECSWRLIAWRTFDGLVYTDARTLYEGERRLWYLSAQLARRDTDGFYLLMKWSPAPGGGSNGHAVWTFGSDDGDHWRPLSAAPAYIDHDAFGLVWDRDTEQFVVFQHTYQDWDKPFRDNAGSGVRRVMHLRTSPDGVHWQPEGKALLKGEKFTEGLYTPDEQDPVEDEFYLFGAFPYYGRYVGMMKHYWPSPAAVMGAGAHGPHGGGEWWVARNVRDWQRPYRDVVAAGEASDVLRQEPMNLGGRHLWLINNQVYGLPERGIFYAGSFSNSRFSTVEFTMPESNILLDAEFGFHGDPARGFAAQAYLMAEVLDEQGRTVPCYEKEKCLFESSPGRNRRLTWRQGEDLQGTWKLAGRRARLRFHLRDARIYAVHT